jgi:hypothetical protein
MFSPAINDCEKFRNGKFYLVDEALGVKYYIERKGSIQIETTENGVVRAVFKVQWKDPCNYELFYRGMTIKGEGDIDKDFDDPMKNVPLKVKIITTTSDYYVFEASMDGMPSKLRGTMWVEK